MKLNICLCIFYILIFTISPAISASLLNTSDSSKDASQGKNIPLEINADNGIICDNEKNTCIASGNVKVLYKDYRLDCDQLITYFRTGKTKKNELWQVEARGNLVMHSTDGQKKIYAQRGLYELDREHITLTEGKLELIVDDLVITATDSLEYSKSENIAYAKGNAKAVKGERIIKGNVLKAYFRQNNQGKHDIERIEADKNVVISTANEIATGDQGSYQKENEVAILQGNVKITRPDGQMEGNYAEVKLDTGLSKVLTQAPSSSLKKDTAATSNPDQRVHVLILPRSKKVI